MSGSGLEVAGHRDAAISPESDEKRKCAQLAGVTYKSEDALTEAEDRWLPVASFCGNAGGKGRAGVLSVDGDATRSRFTPGARQRFQRAGS